MMHVLLMFGPEHGRQFRWDSKNLPNPLEVNSVYDPVIFDDSRNSSRSITRERHRYDLQEIFDQGMDEVALYMHSEHCCEKQIPQERNRNDRPRIR
jgi:hypothetical protein